MASPTDAFNAAAYGGEGWSPRTAPLREEIGRVWAAHRVSTEYSRLKAVLMHRPGPEVDVSADPDAVQWLDAVSLERAQAQHDAVAQAYRDLGVAVHYVDPQGEPSPNQMFLADLMFMTPEGAILARPASTVRAGEERAVARRLADLGVPILRSVRGGGTFEGADALWLNPSTVMMGRGLRTNAEGAAQVKATLNEMGVEVIEVDLPYGTMHLMGMLRFADRDLAIAFPMRLVHKGVEALKENGYQIAFMPHEDEASRNKAFNFVTIGPREIVMSAGNPKTQVFYEQLGITCHPVAVDELSKAAGAMGCLTGILHRE